MTKMNEGNQITLLGKVFFDTNGQWYLFNFILDNKKCNIYIPPAYHKEAAFFHNNNTAVVAKVNVVGEVYYFENFVSKDSFEIFYDIYSNSI